jgi:phosphatidylserine/phosphatidylglycerophosphate/cardiolipin synthase-like enzyme
MHDKFVVIDGQWVWTGSWNMTENGAYRNNNNAVLIGSTALAENYTAEFEEMFAGQFGPTSPASTPNPHIAITVETGDGEGGQERQVEVENYFAPEDEVAAQIIAQIAGAQSRIRFMAFTFTSDEIAEAMLEQARAGVVVQGVMEERNAGREYSEYERLRAEVHDVLPDGNPYIMHHKVIIIDDTTVILGSYNFTANAEENNDENLLIIHDPEVAALFVAEFGRVYEQARTADSRTVTDFFASATGAR